MCSGKLNLNLHTLKVESAQKSLSNRGGVVQFCCALSGNRSVSSSVLSLSFNFHRSLYLHRSTFIVHFIVIVQLLSFTLSSSFTFCRSLTLSSSFIFTVSKYFTFRTSCEKHEIFTLDEPKKRSKRFPFRKKLLL